MNKIRVLHIGIKNWPYDTAFSKDELIGMQKASEAVAYTLKEMQELLHKNNLDIVKKHKYDERILFVCKKR